MRLGASSSANVLAARAPVSRCGVQTALCLEGDRYPRRLDRPLRARADRPSRTASRRARDAGLSSTIFCLTLRPAAQPRLAGGWQRAPAGCIRRQHLDAFRKALALDPSNEVTSLIEQALTIEPSRAPVR